MLTLSLPLKAPSEASSDQFCCDDASDASDASCPNANSQRRLPCLDWAEGMAEYPAPTNVELVLTSRVIQVVTLLSSFFFLLSSFFFLLLLLLSSFIFHLSFVFFFPDLCSYFLLL